jgi:hypothetical protein
VPSVSCAELDDFIKENRTSFLWTTTLKYILSTTAIREYNHIQSRSRISGSESEHFPGNCPLL